jgi:hypothetical protein
MERKRQQRLAAPKALVERSIAQTLKVQLKIVNLL